MINRKMHFMTNTSLPTLEINESLADTNNPEWDCIDIDHNGIIVTWQEKYGPTKTVECIGLWYSNKRQEYMLTWKDSKKIYINAENKVNYSIFRHYQKSQHQLGPPNNGRDSR